MPVPTITILTNELYMAGNPVLAWLYTGLNMSGRYRLYKHDGTEGVYAYTILIYEGIVFTASDYAEVNLTSLFADLKSTAGVERYCLTLVDAEDVESGFVDGQMVVYGGGISKLMTRQLIGSIFQNKLANNDVNFFLSTRTNNTTITIREDELLPLYFYGKGHSFTVKANNITVATYAHGLYDIDSLQSLDFAALRLALITSDNVLASVFDILTDTSYICSIMITEGEPTNYFLKFKNSWGAWEKIALSADMDYMPVMGEAVKVAKYDALISDFVNKTERKEITNIYQASTTYRNSDDRLFLLDMLHSQDVILIAHGHEYAVNVTTDTNMFATTKGEPGIVSLKIELIDTDEFFSPLIVEDEFETLGATTLEQITSGGAVILL